MSVFRQLMMKEKVEEMPLTVVGSPTITDGVVSGFSNSNYLQMLRFAQYKPFEFVLKIKTGTRPSDTAYLIRSSGLLLYWMWSYQLIFYLRNTANTQASIEGTTKLLANTDYWIKMKYDGTTMYLYLSTDGNTYNLENSRAIDVISINYDTNIGIQKSSGGIFNGTMDIKNSYLILDGTKYIFTIGA